MFGFGKNHIKTQIDELKKTSEECAILKDEVVTLLASENNLNCDEVAKIKSLLEVYKEIKSDILSIKNSDLNPKEKLKAISNKKDSIVRVKLDLEKAKELLKGEKS